MRRAIVKNVGLDKWVICPGCGRTIKVIRDGEAVNIPEICPHCGNDVWYEEETEQE